MSFPKDNAPVGFSSPFNTIFAVAFGPDTPIPNQGQAAEDSWLAWRDSIIAERMKNLAQKRAGSKSTPKPPPREMLAQSRSNTVFWARLSEKNELNRLYARQRAA